MAPVNAATVPRLLLALLGATAALFCWFVTTHGPGVSPDSVIYLAVARSLVRGDGFMMDGAPMTHFPPGLPLLIAAFTPIARNPLAAARVVAALTFGINVMLVGGVTWRFTGRSIRAAVIAVLLFVISGPVLNLHTMAWSEAPFFACVLGGLALLTHWTAEGTRRILVAAALLFGIAIIFRYAGLPLVAPLLAAVLLRPATLRQRVTDLCIAGATAMLPLSVWVVHNAITAKQATDRVLALHLVDADALRQLLATLADYFLPLLESTWYHAAVVVLLVIVAYVLWILLRRRGDPRIAGDPALTFPLLSAAWVASYVLFLLVSISIADATTPLDDRILFPVFGVAVPSLAILAATFTARSGQRRVFGTFALFALVCVGLRLPRAIDDMTAVHDHGEGYQADDWQRSPLMQQVKALPPGIDVYSNVWDAVQYVGGRPGSWLPDPLIWESMQPNPEYDSLRAEMCKRMVAGRAVIAFFRTEEVGDSTQQADAAAMCPGATAVDAGDGVLLSIPR